MNKKKFYLSSENYIIKSYFMYNIFKYVENQFDLKPLFNYINKKYIYLFICSLQYIQTFIYKYIY